MLLPVYFSSQTKLGEMESWQQSIGEKLKWFHAWLLVFVVDLLFSSKIVPKSISAHN